VGSPQAALQRATDAGLPCGVGGRAPLGALAGSVREALAGLSLSRRWGRPVTARELATLDALLDQAPDARLRPFVAQLLEPLAAHDSATGARLLPTLQAFIDGGAAVVPVARSLYLHPNTLRYRLHRVAQLTERDPLVPADRVDFVVALRAADRRGLLRRREG
jgi:DNA-binding PucR family transcriptional regulator